MGFWHFSKKIWVLAARLVARNFTRALGYAKRPLSVVHAFAGARERRRPLSRFPRSKRFKTMWDISCRGGRQRVIFGTYSQIMLATCSKDVKGSWLCENDNIFTICSKFSVCPPRKWNIPIPASRQRKIEQNDLYQSISKLLMTC